MNDKNKFDALGSDINPGWSPCSMDSAGLTSSLGLSSSEVNGTRMVLEEEAITAIDIKDSGYDLIGTDKKEEDTDGTVVPLQTEESQEQHSKNKEGGLDIPQTEVETDEN